MAARAGDQIDGAIRQASVDSGRSMSSAGKGAGSDTGDNELYKLNQVFYRAIPSLSTVAERNLQRTQFQQTTYQNLQQQTLTCILNTGENFINPLQSFLVMQLGIPLTAMGANAKNWDIHAWLSAGGVASIIDEVWLTSASGTEICREQNKGLQITHYLLNTLTPEYIRRNGIQEGICAPNLSDAYSGRGYCRAALGASTYRGPVVDRAGAYASGGSDATAAGALNVIIPSVMNDQGMVDLTYCTTNSTDGTRLAGAAPIFAIPMNHILGCFDPYLQCLMPGALLAGAQLNIRIKNLVEPLMITGSGLQYNAAADTDASRLLYARNLCNTAVISQIYIQFDCYKMNDSVVRKINQISAGSNGLTMMFDTFDWTSTNATGTQVEAQVSQARSRIKCSWCVVRDNDSVSNPFVPSLLSEAAIRRDVGPAKYDDQIICTAYPPTVTTYQGILGSLYFPQQNISNYLEMYENQLYIFGKALRDDTDVGCVSIQDWAGALGSANYNAGDIQSSVSNIGWTSPYGAAIYGLTAERSSLLQMTGLTIANARLLRHRFTFQGATVSGEPRIIDVFTQFTRQAKIFLGGRVVMRE